jgi:hypothetical protein
MSKFLATASSRETSPELMEAILFAAGGNEEIAESIWTHGPNSAELVCIVERVTKNGLHKTTDFNWGAAGGNWAE